MTMRKSIHHGGPHDTANEAGFTLLELLVGLVVLGFILVGLTQATRFGLRATATQQRLDDGRAELDAVDRTLRRLFAQAEPGNDHSGPALTGTAATMTFVSTLPEAVLGSVATPGNTAIAPSIAPSISVGLGLDASHALVLRWTPYVHARPLGSPPAPATADLLHDVAHIEFAYWRQQAGWQQAWDRRELPLLIRVRLVFPPGDPRHWPDMVFASARQKIE